LRVYPCLAEPCNFLLAHAEHLPFESQVFYYVHMRSVIDHFYDPYLSLIEANRVLRCNGGIMLMVGIKEEESGISKDSGLSLLLLRLWEKIREKGLQGLMFAIIKRIYNLTQPDIHIWHPAFIDLTDIL